MDRFSMGRATHEFETLLRKYPSYHFIGNCDIKLPVKQFVNNKNNIILAMNDINYGKTNKSKSRVVKKIS